MSSGGDTEATLSMLLVFRRQDVRVMILEQAFIC
jgi:hypothetical protein